MVAVVVVVVVVVIVVGSSGPPDSPTTSLQQRVQTFETRFSEAQEIRQLRRAGHSLAPNPSSIRSPLAVLQDRLRVFRVCQQVPRFSSLYNRALRQPDLSPGTLVLVVRQHESMLPSGVHMRWQELALGGLSRIAQMTWRHAKRVLWRRSASFFFRRSKWAKLRHP